MLRYSSSLWVSTLTRPLHQFYLPHKKQFFKCPHTVWKLSFNKYTDSPGRNRSHIYLCLFTTTRGMFDQEPFSLTKIIRNKKWTQGGGGGHFTIFLYTRIREGRDVGRVLLKCMCHVQAALKYSAHKSLLWVFISGAT